MLAHYAESGDQVNALAAARMATATVGARAGKRLALPLCMGIMNGMAHGHATIALNLVTQPAARGWVDARGGPSIKSPIEPAHPPCR